MRPTTRVSQINEKIEQHQKNKDSIRCLQQNNCLIEAELVEIIIDAKAYSALNINWSRLNHFLYSENKYTQA